MVRAVAWVSFVLALAPISAAAAPDCREPWIAGPVVDPAAKLELVSSETRVRCRGMGRARMSCEIAESYVVHNPSASTVIADAAVYARRDLTQTVTVDGTTPPGTKPPVVDENDGGVPLHWLADGNTQAFALTIPGGASRRIDVHTSGLHRNRICEPTLVLERRHLLVSRDLRPRVGYDAWGPVGLEGYPVSRSTVDVPPSWRMAKKTELRRDPRGPRGRWITNRPHPRWIERAPVIGWGGPFVAIGLTGNAKHTEPKLRAGWELGLGRRWITSVAVESDARRHVDVVPVIEAVGRLRRRVDFLWLPSPAFGVGVPVRTWPDPRPGVRLQVAAHWPVVGLVVMFDAYPRTRTEPPRYLGGAALQLGF